MEINCATEYVCVVCETGVVVTAVMVLPHVPGGAVETERYPCSTYVVAFEPLSPVHDTLARAYIKSFNDSSTCPGCDGASVGAKDLLNDDAVPCPSTGDNEENGYLSMPSIGQEAAADGVHTVGVDGSAFGPVNADLHGHAVTRNVHWNDDRDLACKEQNKSVLPTWTASVLLGAQGPGLGAGVPKIVTVPSGAPDINQTFELAPVPYGDNAKVTVDAPCVRGPESVCMAEQADVLIERRRCVTLCFNLRGLVARYIVTPWNVLGRCPVANGDRLRMLGDTKVTNRSK